MNNFDNIPMVQAPENLKISLYNHQLASIYNMEKLENDNIIPTSNNEYRETKIGVNADLSGFGKCHAINTPILMFDGTIKMVQDIIVGDLIMGDDSTTRNVLSLARGIDEMYDIIQDNHKYTVNQAHILCLKHENYPFLRNKNNYYLVKWIENNKFKKKLFRYTKDNEKSVENETKVFFNSITHEQVIEISVKDYLKLPKTKRNSLKGFRVGVQFSTKSLDIDPYLVGYWLGNNKLDSYNSIPYNYKCNSTENRLQLLAGLLDSGGSTRNNKYYYSHNNKVFIDDIVYLIRSLGLKCNIKKLETVKYKVLILGTDMLNIPTRIRKIVNNKSNKGGNLLYKIQINPIGQDNYYGFTLDKNNRYLIGDFTVTHNTFSMIGLIMRNKMEWDLDVPCVSENIRIQAEGRIKSYKIIRYNKIPTNLVLMSQSIIGQWETELSYTPLKYISIKTKQDLNALQAEEYDVVLVIPTMFNKLNAIYSNCAWKRFIFDEPGNLKVSGMTEIQAGFFWFITSTPMQIFFHHYRCKGSFMRELIGSSYSEFEQLFKDIIVKNDDEFVKSSFKMPKTYHHYYKCYQPIYNIIHSFVTDSIKNMIESGNIEGAIIALGGNRTTNIVDLILNKKKTELAELDIKEKLYILRQDDIKIKEIEDKKTRIIAQINDLDSKYKNMLQSSCNICCEPLKYPVLEFNCQNLFCGECLLKWLQRKNSCPLCRTEIDVKTLIYVNNGETENAQEHINIHKNMTKIETIVDIINKNKGGKFLIFSDHDNSFTTISSGLKDNNISYVQIRGNIKTTEKNLDLFKNGDIQVIFLNAKFNGAGINLQQATDIILYHEMNFYIEAQILARANRIGRIIPLNVHHLQIH